MRFEIYREISENGKYYAIIDGVDVSYLNEKIDPECYYIITFKRNGQLNDKIQDILKQSETFVLIVNENNITYDKKHKRIVVDNHYNFEICEESTNGNDNYDLTNEFYEECIVPDYMMGENED